MSSQALLWTAAGKVPHSTAGKLCLSMLPALGNAGLKGSLPATSWGMGMVYFCRHASVRRTPQTLASAFSLPIPQKIWQLSSKVPDLNLLRMWHTPAPAHILSTRSVYMCNFWEVGNCTGNAHPSYRWHSAVVFDNKSYLFNKSSELRLNWL